MIKNKQMKREMDSAHIARHSRHCSDEKSRNKVEVPEGVSRRLDLTPLR